MKFKIIRQDLMGVSSNYIILHPTTAEEYEITPGTLLRAAEKDVAFRVLTSSGIEQGIAGISTQNLDHNGLCEGEVVNFVPTGVEGVTRIIRRKMNKRTLTDIEIETFIAALDSGKLTNASFGTAVEINGMQEKEIVSVAESILKHSETWSFPGKTVVDKHSIGGIAGNRISPLMIPIIASAGLIIPKVSTRAITSPAGTVDALEVVTNPNLTSEEALKVVEKANGCIVNGATVGLGDVMDRFLDAVKQVKVDPKELMIASILAKKKAAGVRKLIPAPPRGAVA